MNTPSPASNTPPSFEEAVAHYCRIKNAVVPPLAPDFAASVVQRFPVPVPRSPWLGFGRIALLLTLGFTVAGSVTYWYWPKPVEPQGLPTPGPIEPLQPDTVSPPRRLGDTLSEAGQSIAMLSRDTAGQALEPTRALLSSTALPAWPERVPAEPKAWPGQALQEPLSTVPQAARDSLSPVASAPRRAIALFLRDTGFAAQANN